MSTDLSIDAPHQKLVIWSTALGIIAAGVYLSHIQLLGNEWLSRSGCMIVILGIWSGLGGIIRMRLLTGRLRRRRKNTIIQAKAVLEERDTDPAEITKEIKKIEEVFDQEGTELAQRLRLSVGILEVSLLMTGTFLWGFGDLIIKYIITK